MEVLYSMLIVLCWINVSFSENKVFSYNENDIDSKIKTKREIESQQNYYQQKPPYIKKNQFQQDLYQHPHLMPNERNQQQYYSTPSNPGLEIPQQKQFNNQRINKNTYRPMHLQKPHFNQNYREFTRDRNYGQQKQNHYDPRNNQPQRYLGMNQKNKNFSPYNQNYNRFKPLNYNPQAHFNPNNQAPYYPPKENQPYYNVPNNPNQPFNPQQPPAPYYNQPESVSPQPPTEQPSNPYFRMYSTCQKCPSIIVPSSETGSCCCTQLNDIKCSQMTSLPSFTPNTAAFIGAYLDNQLITNVPESAFDSFKVRKLNLNSNPISASLQDSSFRLLSDHLHELYLGNCDLASLPPNLVKPLSNLQHLHLWNNNIKRIPGNFFKNSNQLQELFLWGNKLESLEENTFIGLSSLKKLDLDRNKLKTIHNSSFEPLRELRILNLADNFIQVFSADNFNSLSNLKVLTMSNNMIQSFGGQGLFLEQLFALHLDHNHIATIEAHFFQKLDQLGTFVLNNNKLSINKNDENPFIHLRSLERLDLSSNNINELSIESLSALSKLRYLYLDHNNLKKLEKCVFSVDVKLRTLSLIGNSLTCNCASSWMIDLVNKTQLWGVCHLPSTPNKPRSLYLNHTDYCPEECLHRSE